MATITKIQGEEVSFSLDASSLGTITSIIFEVYKSTTMVSVLKYRYPAATGYETVTKNLNTYSFTITEAQSANLIGLYGIELTYDVAGVTSKVQAEGLYFNKQSV